MGNVQHIALTRCFAQNKRESKRENENISKDARFKSTSVQFSYALSNIYFQTNQTNGK